jgi:hypothetical protein
MVRGDAETGSAGRFDEFFNFCRGLNTNHSPKKLTLLFFKDIFTEYLLIDTVIIESFMGLAIVSIYYIQRFFCLQRSYASIFVCCWMLNGLIRLSSGTATT